MNNITINILPDGFKPLPVVFNTASTRHNQLSTEYKNKKQNFYQILIVLDGNGTLYYNGETYPLKKGCAFFTTKYENSRYDNTGGLTTAFLTVNGDGVSQIISHFGIDRFKFYESVDIKKYVKLIEEIINEYYKTKNEGVLSALSYNFFVSFFEGRQEGTLASLDKTVLYIEKNFSKKLILDELAEINKTSVSKLCHDFKAKYGCTVFQHILNLRLNYANSLLNSLSDIKTKDVAKSCGFEDVSYFCKAYKAKFGIRPSDTKAE